MPGKPRRDGLWVLGLVVALIAALAGCDERKPSAGAMGGAAKPRMVRVAAASSMKTSLDELAKAFAAANPGVDVTTTYGASGTLTAQLANQAPFDVFMSADLVYPRRLVESGVARADSERRYARGVLVVWAPAESKLDLSRGIKVLANPSIAHIAIANPEHAPYGRAAQAAITAAGIEEQVRDKIVLGENVEQAAQFAQTGAAEVALIPLSLAMGPAMSAGEREAVDRSLYPPVEHGMVVMAAAASPADARAFCDYVLSTAGRETLARHGFDAPGD